MTDLSQQRESEDELRTLRASPISCGLATVGTAADRITVVVLPKAWKRDEPDYLRRDHPDGSPLFLTLYQGQRITLRLSSSTQRKSLRDLLSVCAAEAQGADSSASDVVDDDITKSRLQLLSSADNKSGAPETIAPPSDDQLEKAYRGIVHLLLFDHASCRGTERYTARLQDPFLAPIVHERFVVELKRNLRWLRRGYVEVRERSDTVRGRIDTASLGVSLQGRSPQLTCIFDSFTERTPLLRVIATALDVVARGTWLDHHEGLSGHHGASGGIRSVREDARRIRRILAEIPSLPIGTARTLSTRIRLSSMQRRRWEETLALARDVLLEHGPDFQKSSRRSAPMVWRLPMPTRWELILKKALLAGWPAQEVGEGVFSQIRIPPPWPLGSAGLRRLDLVFQVGAKRFVLDAKYSMKDSVPNPGYLNQVFVYGVYAKPDEWNGALCTDVGLVFAAKPEASPLVERRHRQTPPVSHDIPGHEKSRSLALHLLWVAFPSEDHLRPARSAAEKAPFDQYLEKVGKALHGKLKG